MITFVKKVLTMVDSLKQIAIGCDHAGFDTKEFIKQNLVESGYSFHDFGTFSEESMDYPDVAHPLADAVEKGDYYPGILICGSGNGVSMVANKHKRIRAALCWTEEIARLARLHNDANILSLPARFITTEDALKIVEIFLNTAFEGGRHQKRVDKI